MKRLLLLIFILSCSISSKATHLVGGEFELIHQVDSTYLLRQIQYFDEVNGNPAIVSGAAQETFITASIFQKSNRTLVRQVVLQRVEFEDFVPYTNRICEIDELITRRIIFETTLELPPSVYNHPEGYIIVWERCCRNETITNIVTPDNTGQTFVLEFPPVIKEGQPFINSSPRLFPPLRDYACANEFFYTDFAGTDADGDSISYSLVAPLNSSVFIPVPPPTPPPHNEVNFVGGVGAGNMVPGSPPLRISTEGLLTVNPSSAGLFVFSVKAEEFRDGERIGEVRRDFQMLVINCLPPGENPELTAQGMDGANLFDNSIVSFNREDEKCLSFFITDEDANERVSIRARPVNFIGQIDTIFSVNGGRLIGDDDTLKIEVCVPDCPFTPSGVAIIDFIAMDNSCPLPLLDTLRLRFDVEPPLNEDPQFSLGTEQISVSIREGDSYQLDIPGIDNDLDFMELSVLTDGFILDQFGIELDTLTDEAGNFLARLTWDTDCQVFDFTERNTFNFEFRLEDKDECLQENFDVLNLFIEVELPPNTDPVLSSSINISDTLDLFAGESLSFTLNGLDTDNDIVILTGEALNFNENDLSLKFDDMEGVTEVRSEFTLTTQCDDLDFESRNPHRYLFTLNDLDKCKFPNFDSLTLMVNIIPPPNESPVLTVSEESPTFELIAGSRFELDFLGNDQDGDTILLDLVNSSGFEGRVPYQFEPVQGVGAVSSQLVWETTCNDLENGLFEEQYSLTFALTDRNCRSVLGDTIVIDVTIRDLEDNFDVGTFPNVFTPNGDTPNQFFQIPDLPSDNCESQLEKVGIYNRWGREVFSSGSKDFQWDGANEPTGVYYYNVEYTTFDIEGWVHLLR